MEPYPIFVDTVLNHISGDSPEFSLAVNCLKELFKTLGMVTIVVLQSTHFILKLYIMLDDTFSFDVSKVVSFGLGLPCPQV